MKKFKIIHLITRLDKGGSAENTFLSAREFHRKGHSVSVWTGADFDLPRDIQSEAGSEGVELHFLPSLKRSIHPFYDFIALFQLIKLIKKEKPDIVHTHTSKAGFLGRLAAWLCRVPVIVHTPHGHVFYGYFGFLKTKFYLYLERLASLWSDAIIPLTEHGKKEYLKYKVGKDWQLVAIPSGIDFSQLKLDSNKAIQLRKKNRISLNEKVVGSIGRFAPIKGFDLIVEAAPLVLKQFPEVIFYLAGIGPLKETLIKRVSELGINANFRFDDFQSIEAPLQMIDILLLPSRNEGQSRTLVEGMFFEKPIVATSVGGVPDVLTHMKTGLLVSPEKPKELADSIIKLLKDDHLCDDLKVAAKKDALNRFSLNEMIEKLDHLYLDLSKEKEKSN